MCTIFAYKKQFWSYSLRSLECISYDEWFLGVLFDVWMLYGVAQPSLIWESARRMALNGLCVCHWLRIVSRYPAHYVFVLLLNAYDWGLNPMDFPSFSLEQRCNKTKKSRYPKVLFRTPQGSPWFIEVIKWTLYILCFQPPTTYWSCVDHVKNLCLQNLSEPPSQLSGSSLPAPSSFSNGSSHRLQAKWIREKQ